MNKCIIIPIATPNMRPHIMVAPVNAEKIKAEFEFQNIEISISSMVPTDMIYFINYDEWVKEKINNTVNKLIDN